MKLPRVMTLMGEKVKIKQQKNCKMDGEEVFGYYDPALKCIFLEKNLLDAQKLETLKHEIIHFICDISGISDQVSEDTEHTICATFARLIYLPIDKENNIDLN
jgi:Zn-dependent peptidase ImmA (M78 family)